MAPYVYDNAAMQNALTKTPEERKEMVTKIAMREGTFAGLTALGAWGATAYLIQRAKVFPNIRLNASAKTAFVIIPPFMVFAFVSEQVTTRLANPGAFSQYLVKKQVSALPPHKRFANFILNEPYKLLFGMGLGAIGLIFTRKSGDAELTISQRIMHTRVLAQFTVLATLGSVMGFRSWMMERGPFLEPWEEEAVALKRREEEEENRVNARH